MATRDHNDNPDKYDAQLKCCGHAVRLYALLEGVGISLDMATSPPAVLKSFGEQISKRLGESTLKGESPIDSVLHGTALGIYIQELQNEIRELTALADKLSVECILLRNQTPSPERPKCFAPEHVGPCKEEDKP